MSEEVLPLDETIFDDLKSSIDKLNETLLNPIEQEQEQDETLLEILEILQLDQVEEVLTEEEQYELEETLQLEEEYKKLQQDFYLNNSDNSSELSLVIESNQHINQSLEKLIEQNEMANITDFTVFMALAAVLPTVLICYLFYKFMNWFID